MDNVCTVKIGSGSERAYNFYAGNGLISRITKYLPSDIRKNSKIAIITDDNVRALYAETVEASLKKEGFAVYTFSFTPGEGSKNIETYVRALEFLADNKFARSDAVVALGGGVVGDLAGFTASTYMRGIGYVQVPTTLLAMTDSSVGGKTGIDLKSGKNLVGAFYRPLAVIADIDVLKTLPREQFVCGMGEIIKYACLDGGRIAQIVESGVTDQNITELIMLSVKSKARIVDEDEHENGARRLLNLGHTLGHAVETLSGYTVLHGEAVAKGIYSVAQSAVRRGELSTDDFIRIERMISLYGICVDVPYPADDILECVTHDKKADGDGVRLVLISGIGKCYVKYVETKDIKEYLI